MGKCYFLNAFIENSVGLFGWIMQKNDNEYLTNLFVLSSPEFSSQRINEIKFFLGKSLYLKYGNVGEISWECEMNLNFSKEGDFNYVGEITFSEKPCKRENLKVKAFLVESLL